MTEIPVYVFTGFLGAGKTTFIQKTLEDARFNDGTSTLVLQCEDGEEELDESRFANKKAVHLEKIDDQEALTSASTARKRFSSSTTECGSSRSSSRRCPTAG